ncbi:MAG: CoA-binding protein, partial [Acetobacteraceae bacterium]|nr:CoA-binding protein [Acetobacteraceae bacterium]
MTTSEDETIRDILLSTRRIAVVGASDKPARPSFGVAAFLRDRGYAVTPVNPGIAGRTLHGAAVAARLDEAGPLDMVDVFRRSSEAGAAVDEAIRLGARSVWL